MEIAGRTAFRSLLYLKKGFLLMENYHNKFFFSLTLQVEGAKPPFSFTVHMLQNSSVKRATLHCLSWFFIVRLREIHKQKIFSLFKRMRGSIKRTDFKYCILLESNSPVNVAQNSVKKCKRTVLGSFPAPSQSKAFAILKIIMLSSGT